MIHLIIVLLAIDSSVLSIELDLVFNSRLLIVERLTRPFCQLYSFTCLVNKQVPEHNEPLYFLHLPSLLGTGCKLLGWQNPFLSMFSSLGLLDSSVVPTNSNIAISSDR